MTENPKQSSFVMLSVSEASPGDPSQTLRCTQGSLRSVQDDNRRIPDDGSAVRFELLRFGF